MKQLHLLHLGIGNVGKALHQYIRLQRHHLKKTFGVDLQYCGMFSSTGGIYQRQRLTEASIRRFPANADSVSVKQAIADALSPFLLIDTTASDRTAPFLAAALARGGYVVLSNKKPLAGRQQQWDDLHKAAGNRLYYETAVGAGLPVISTLQSLLAAGDTILEIRGCFSGTLGFLFSSLDGDVPFSQAVIRAKELGYTEPDPREDLSGQDVARKALILARLLGSRLELTDIPLDRLYPGEFQDVSVDLFLSLLPRQDQSYAKQLQAAKQSGKTLRYVSRITPVSCAVGIQEVETASDIGQLNGPDNLVSIRTKRYDRHPLVIKGPGAGVEVTATGVLSDIIQIIKQLH